MPVFTNAAILSANIGDMAMRFAVLGKFISSFSILLITAIASCDVVTAATFKYTGQPYFSKAIDGLGDFGLLDTTFYGSFLTGSATFDSDVTAGFTGIINQADVTSWSFVSGEISESSSTGDTLQATFTFTNGEITRWDVRASNNTYLLQTSYYAPSLYIDFAGFLREGGYPGTGNTNDGNPGSPFNNGLGSWTRIEIPIATTPLPSAGAMLGASFLLLGAFGLRRRKNDPLAE